MSGKYSQNNPITIKKSLTVNVNINFGTCYRPEIHKIYEKAILVSKTIRFIYMPI